MPKTPGDTITAVREAGFGRNYQTDGGARSSGYALSRWNACKWQSRRDDVMVCLGQRCPYKFCDLEAHLLPEIGSPCVWERWYAARLGDEFAATFPPETVSPYLDDYDQLRDEFVVGHLLANRASVRMSRASEDCMTASARRSKHEPFDYRPFRHHALADRYLAAAHRRMNAMYERLPEIVEKLKIKRARSMMISNGYWKPQNGEDAPEVESIPEWIRKHVGIQS